MPSQPQSSAGKDRLVHDEKRKEQAEWSSASGAEAMTVEEREDEREAISRARPGGIERVLNEQRLPAEGIGAADGRLRHAATNNPDQDSAAKQVESGEYAGAELSAGDAWKRAGGQSDHHQGDSLDPGPDHGISAADPGLRDLDQARSRGKPSRKTGKHAGDRDRRG